LPAMFLSGVKVHMFWDIGMATLEFVVREFDEQV